MTATTKKTTKPRKDKSKEAEVLDQALEWATDVAPSKADCIFCGWQRAIPEKTEGNSLKKHIRMSHQAQVVLCFMQQDVNAFSKLMSGEVEAVAPEAQEPEEDFEAAGDLEITDLGGWDALFVPAKIRRKYESEGAKIYWANPKNIARYENQGLRLAEMPPGVRMPNQHSNEGSMVKTGEMVLMVVPREVRERRQALRDRKVDNQLMARKEELFNTLQASEKDIFDKCKAKGMSSDAAMKIARAAQSGGLSVETSKGLFDR